MKITIYFIFFALLNVSFSHAMDLFKEDEASTLVVYAVPGINGGGSGEEYLQKILGNSLKIVSLGTPQRHPDLGQATCLHHLDEGLKNETHNGIIHATSQGTATVLNHFDDQSLNIEIKALILESVVGSGNSAIFHRATESMNMHYIKKIPGSYYWLPYLAMLKLPNYRPGGKQPIKSLAQITTDVPIIIIHSKNDRQLSYDDACALYYSLNLHGNHNVYFISKEGSQHINILSSEDDYTIVRSILYNHGLLDDSETIDIEIDLSEYQPDPTLFKECYINLVQKELKHEVLEKGLIGVIIVFIIVITSYSLV